MGSNRLSHESSPYLLQHAYQPVDWYPWGEEAFFRANREDKPVFLSIGYSTCHWCHVMGRESFADEKIGALLNENYVCVKVDREERPDIDSVYMSVCQAMTGSGGWPMSIFLTPGKKPFFAGTYFPKDDQRGMMGFSRLLTVIAEKWKNDRQSLLLAGEQVIQTLSAGEIKKSALDESLLKRAARQFEQRFDGGYGGFGDAPKFPTAHNLLFLLERFRQTGEQAPLDMAELTLRQMYRGGLFDHIGFGFCRYATDRAFQIPHFEKMLYDNALLIMAYAKAFDVTGNSFYRDVAEQTADYVLRELTSADGGFFSAQDADSDGVEGRYYVLTPEEVRQALDPKCAEAFCRCFGITEQGNFEVGSIPHLVGKYEQAAALRELLPKMRAYRRERSRLSLDDKILTAWNGLMMGALAQLFRVTGEERYLSAALDCAAFMEGRLAQDDLLFVSTRGDARGSFGFLDDYACAAFGLLELYQAGQRPALLAWAQRLSRRVLSDFQDEAQGGFFLSGRNNEALILRPKETYDGAMPSGNSVMAYVLVRLAQTTFEPEWEEAAARQLAFMSGAAQEYPMGHAFFLLALSAHVRPLNHVTVVLGEDDDTACAVCRFGLDVLVTVLDKPTDGYRLLNGRTTYYGCDDDTCLAPENEPPDFGKEE